ncbi:hypothetical protein [Chondromyces crocatus]|uniref:Uncharacterized protein n=1 Tax=Chondromyces crocatus TaxID=52 RepID=A0A0K1EF18_CHOCO|nr:hypothetical protein [Chondromyces crocatus]AKT39287.1 uncharacterized protein CMC5_034350 [Chondromyces crocatus]
MLAAALAACGNDSRSADLGGARDDTRSAATANPSSTVTAATIGATPTGTTQTPTLPASATPATADAAGPKGRSPVPKPEEFATVPEVTVIGSSALNCETKMVREWLRISCRGQTKAGSKPVDVIRSRSGKDVHLFVDTDLLSLVFPFEPGTDVAATFMWSGESHLFTSEWPRGAPKPTRMGIFERVGAPKP